MTDCIFCKIVKKQIPTELLFEDDQTLVFKDIHPKANTHLLIISKEHINSLSHASEQHAKLLSHMLLLLPKLAMDLGLDGFRTILNTGKGGGQEIDHIHFHLLSGNLHPM